MVLGTDMHHVANFHFMTFGVGIARRAWCTREAILNTWKWKDIETFVNRKRKKMGALLLHELP